MPRKTRVYRQPPARVRPDITVVEQDTGPATWKDVSPSRFNRPDEDIFVDKEWWDHEHDDLVAAHDQLLDGQEIKRLQTREMAQEDGKLLSGKTRRSICDIVRDEAGEIVRYYVHKGHKRGQPSGRKRRDKFTRHTIRDLQPTDPQTFEFELWLGDELPLPDMGMISQHALEIEEAMIFAAEYNDDDMYVQEIMLPLEELIAA
jgi:hypothetical protein